MTVHTKSSIALEVAAAVADGTDPVLCGDGESVVCYDPRCPDADHPVYCTRASTHYDDVHIAQTPDGKIAAVWPVWPAAHD